jgi:hypothetical protein
MQTSRLRLSPNFRIEEFDCRDGTRVPSSAVPALRTWCKAWGEPMRTRFGPIRVTSGFRTPRYNASVGGAPASFHVYTLGTARGVAADVVPATGDPRAWGQWATAHYRDVSWPLVQGRGAAVPYPSQGFIHLDTGPRRSWAG